MNMDAGSVPVTLHSGHVVHESGHADLPSASNQIEIEDEDGNDNELARQVKAFLEASEDVDVDEETIDDILQALAENPVDIEINQDSHSSDGDLNTATKKLDIPSLFENKRKVDKPWSKEDVLKLKCVVKEQGTSFFIEEFVRSRGFAIPKLLQAFGIYLCPELQNRRPQTLLYFLRVVIADQLRDRDRQAQYNTITDAVQLIQKSRRILVLTGAGISVSCGIPDFRSRDGLYASLKNKGEYDLSDPQQMFDIQYFRENPSVFFSFASQIYPSNFVPSPCHRFIKRIEDEGKLLRNYTQNIDTLETLAGVKNVLQCHGSFATASCLQCRRRVPGSEIESDILRQKVPLCTVCNVDSSAPLPPKGKKSKKKAKEQWDSDIEDESDGPEYPPGIMKPDITFFGEKLTDDFDNSLAEDRLQADLLLVIGTSLKVSPVAEILSHLPHSTPQILINKTPIRHINPDIVLLGNADEIVLHLSKQLGWELSPPTETTQTTTNSNRLYPPRGNLKKRPSTDDCESLEPSPPQRVGESHVWLFDGAEGGEWLQKLKRAQDVPTRTPSTTVTSGDNTPQSTPGTSATKEAEGRPSKKLRSG
ncbi:DHS-like NAD/FAD-binding domain-containing protein [Crassisporium funariophilum]|nr:DHS-like NAD/FAD-binding domain-containing protein [Crassisporium funariophilum]